MVAFPLSLASLVDMSTRRGLRSLPKVLHNSKTLRYVFNHIKRVRVPIKEFFQVLNSFRVSPRTKRFLCDRD